MNKRRYVRVGFEASCEVESLDGDFSPFEAESTKDISLKGLYLITDRRLPLGTICLLKLKLTGATSELVLDIKAKVVRTDDNGLAFLFEEIDLDSFYHLKNILYYNSGEPEVIDKEIIQG